MLVGKIKKEITKAMTELVQEGLITSLIHSALKDLIEHSEVGYDLSTKSITIKYKKDI